MNTYNPARLQFQTAMKRHHRIATNDYEPTDRSATGRGRNQFLSDSYTSETPLRKASPLDNEQSI
jgi:hypothetical protein